MIRFIKEKYNPLSVILIIIILFVAFLFCLKKQGFYIDEYYQYTLANGTQLGIDIKTGEWNDTSRFVSQLVSEGEENYHFKQMYDTTESDVHPFLYYAIIHFVSSVFSGVFSKWIGLSVNLAIFVPVLILVKKIAWKLSKENEIVTLLTVAMFGLSPATLSIVVLIRMYLLLTLWTLLHVYLHICDLERDSLSVQKFLIPVFICGFCGFLTQYFFVVIMFFVTFVYAFYLFVFCHRYRDTFVYGITSIGSLICTFFVWPISYFHIFKGYRGKGAFSQFADTSKWLDRFCTHIEYLNKMVFGGLLPVFALMFLWGVVFIFVTCYRIRSKNKESVMSVISIPAKGFILVLISSFFDYIVLTQIALIDGITCIRQYYTAYALFLILTPIGVYRLLKSINRSEIISLAVTFFLAFAVLLLGHIQKNVLYLYQDEKTATDYAKDNPDSKVIVFQNDDGLYDGLIQEIILYPRVYFASVNDLETAEDDEIAAAQELLVYVPTHSENGEACFDALYRQNRNLKNAEHLWNTASFSAYLVH